MDEWREESTERVMGFSTEPHYVNITFSQHAGVYQLPVSRDDFVAQMTQLAAAWKSGREVAIILRGQEVMSIGTP